MVISVLSQIPIIGRMLFKMKQLKVLSIKKSFLYMVKIGKVIINIIYYYKKYMDVYVQIVEAGQF